MPPSPSPTPPRTTFAERLRAYFLAGILVTGPIGLTFYVAWFVIDFIDTRVTQLIPEPWNPARYLPVHVPGLGLVVVAVGLTLVGWLAAGYLGRQMLKAGDRILAAMPFIRGLYGAMKQIFETVLSNKSNTFREVVLVEWPRRGSWTVAFVTGRPEGEIVTLTEDDIINLYVPTTPNPTSGYLIHVPRRDVMLLSMTVEEGIKFVISGGIVAPPSRAAAPTAEPALESAGTVPQPERR